ncbi:hypothetical protein ASG94_14335 [Nocardioides sp. Soil805]|nr:hypothetical protein ASG94_14335 [Nocardioides sp. Soil805]
MRLRAPITWSQVPDKLSFRQAAFPPFHESYVSVFRFPNLSGATLDVLGDASLKNKDWTPRAQRLEDQVIDDQPVYHLAGPRRDGAHRETFGTVLDDAELQVTFEFTEDEPPAYRDDVIASVLETVDFGEASVELPEPGSVAPAPARGPVIKIPAARLRIPVYWEATDFPLPTLTGAFPRGVLGTSISLATTPQGDVADLEELGDASVTAKGWRSRATRLDDVVIDDQPTVHVAGDVAPGTYVERFALLVDGERLDVTFTFANDEKPAYRDEIVASVLPTIRLAG